MHPFQRARDGWWWFWSGNFDTAIKKNLPGLPKRVEENESKALPDKDYCETQEELAK